MRKPTVLLELSGAYRKNPSRRRAAEPQPVGSLGEPPERLPIDARPFWNELAAMAAPGVLTSSDRWAVELGARLMEKASRAVSVATLLELAHVAELSSAEVKTLAISERISAAELSTLRSLLGALGLTPADRSRLAIPQSKPSNAFSALAEETRREKERPN